MISEGSAQRIAAALERLAAAVERNPPVPLVPAPAFPAPNGPALAPSYPLYGYQCPNCGGDHGALMCPQLAPKTISGDGA